MYSFQITVHFALLGLPTAVVSCVIALARITLSI
ncbi:YgjV family protein, partial [Parasutterella sp.]